MEPAPVHEELPIINITGQKVALGPLRHELIALYLQWMNDFEVNCTLSIGLGPTTREGAEAWYGMNSRSEGDRFFLVYQRASLRPIGFTALQSIDPHHRTAGFGVLIGEKECWGKGYGTEVAILMLDYGFTALGLHNIQLDVRSDNQRGIRAYQRAGFRIAGRRREAWRMGGCAYEVVMMDCLATEFESPVLRQWLVPTAAPDS